jgi:hypothetical protein
VEAAIEQVTTAFIASYLPCDAKLMFVTVASRSGVTYTMKKKAQQSRARTEILGLGNFFNGKGRTTRNEDSKNRKF